MSRPCRWPDGGCGKEEQAAAEFEDDMGKPDLWEEMPAPSPYRRQLGAQVTIRLEPAIAERLRRLSRYYGCNYTAMLRVWIEERLVHEDAKVERERAAKAAKP